MVSSVVQRLARYLVLAIPALTAVNAHALPSYARQTGEECAACHIGAYGPQLTPHGIDFKLSGYTDHSGNSSAANVPLSAMIVGSFAQTKSSLSDKPTDYTKMNDNTLFQEVSAFVAGKFTDHIGAFIQGTYSGAEHHTALDNVDIRYAQTLDSGVVGVSVNNNPTLTDPFNTLPAWRFPYTSTELVPSAIAAPILDGGLSQQVIGVNAYGFWQHSWYGEAGLYKSLSRVGLDKVGISQDTKLSGTAPYLRMAYFHNGHGQNYSAGVFAFQADIQPDPTVKDKDHYRDIGVDGSYQFLGDREHICTLNGSFIHETQKRDATFNAAEADNLKGSLNEWNLSTSYHYQQTYGLTLGAFHTSGSGDATLYAPETDVGSATGKPNTAGYMVQTDWTPLGKESSWAAPWANLRVGLQYTAYNKFNGTGTNYDGSGRNAHDNNTLFAFVWTSL